MMLGWPPSCVPRLVPPDRLEQANARVIAGQIVGNELAGPAAGGWLFGLAVILPLAVTLLAWRHRRVTA